MSSSPLLVPTSTDNRQYVDVPRNRGFARSPQRGSFTMDSAGRRGIIDAFDLSGAASSAGSVFGSDDEEEVDVYTPTEATRLVREQQTLLDDNNITYGSLSGPLDPRASTLDEVRDELVDTNKVWNRAVEQGKVHTSITRELIVLGNSSLPLIVTFLLQFSLPVASVFSVGHLGKTELGAVSLASMTANITGFAMIQGFATCLDTLCPQAFGAGKFRLVGSYFQKCVVFILCSFVPVGVLWWFSEPLLNMIVPDPEIARLATIYLKIVSFAAPGYILFECGKRFVQAQGIFHASTMILLVCAPFNMTMNYILVWNKNIGIGYAGAPLAVCMTNWLMPLLLFLYVYFIDGKRCWGGLSKNVLKNWGPMFKLAVPGFIMVEAEFFAFEIMTLAASRFGTAALAAQSVLATTTSLSYQVPFAISIAIATRVANFVGATLIEPAQVTSRLGIVISYAIAVMNGLILYFLRYTIGGLFSNDEDVIELVAASMPICALLQLVDAPAAITGGVLRGQGRQHLAGYLNLVAYYIVALPIGFALAFGSGWGLIGLWTGLAIGLIGVAGGETYYIIRSDWQSIVAAAQERDRDERIIAHA